MPNVERDEALQAAERIRRLIAQTPFAHAEKQPSGQVTVSGGVAVWPLDGDDIETLLRHADQALYEAKAAGRNQVRAWAPAGLGADAQQPGLRRAGGGALAGPGPAPPGAAHG